MSHDPVDREQHEVLAYDPIARLLAGMRTDCDALASELDEAFGRLESWRADLEQEAQQLQAKQAGLEREHEHLRQARQACEQADGDAAVELAALREQLSNVERESNEARASLEAEMAAARSELESARSGLESARSELESARSAAQGSHEQLQAAEQREAALVADHAAELLELRGQLEASESSAALQNDMTDLAEQNSALEQELESVRERAGTLSEQLEQAEREAVAREAEWSQEIETLREAVAQQQELAKAAALQAGPARSPQEEAVLGDVVAQFERLRGERTRRTAKDQKKTKRKKK